jgi:lipoprotein-anchoring transpeptidase ErfK/SrfK
MSWSRSVVLVFLSLLFFCLSSCVTKDQDHRVLISVADQTLELYHKNVVVARYPVSTSKFGLSDHPGSRGTPLGKLEIVRKIGDGAPIGAVFKSRRPTGEVIKPDAPGRDPIVTRILWLKGLEPMNRNAFGRCIYIHGTPEERNVGRPASYGCIRMKSADVLKLYDRVGTGAIVEIIPGALPDLPAGGPAPAYPAAASPTPVSQPLDASEGEVTAPTPPPVSNASVR